MSDIYESGILPWRQAPSLGSSWHCSTAGPNINLAPSWGSRRGMRRHNQRATRFDTCSSGGHFCIAIFYVCRLPADYPKKIAEFLDKRGNFWGEGSAGKNCDNHGVSTLLIGFVELRSAVLKKQTSRLPYDIAKSSGNWMSFRMI